MSNLVEKVARAIDDEPYTALKDHEYAQFWRDDVEEKARAAIAVVLREMLDSDGDMAPHNLENVVKWFARENGIEL